MIGAGLLNILARSRGPSRTALSSTSSPVIRRVLTGGTFLHFAA